ACALRSFAAATICLALVIFWVDLTELIRPLSSFSEATALPYLRELLGERVERGLGLVAGFVAELAAFADQSEHVGMFSAHERQHLAFVIGDTLDRDGVEVAVGTGEEIGRAHV